MDSNEIKLRLDELYNYYCSQGSLWCAKCRGTYCMRLEKIFIPIKREVHYKLGCDLCGSDLTLILTASQLVHLSLKYIWKRPDDKLAALYSYLNMFSLLTQFPHLLNQTEKDKINYGSIKKHIREKINNKKKIKQAISFHNGGG